ncbi:MAG: hypothetical protein M1834_000755 [Cirrosporium novae-zelandiae]|nr:MAG: hypothetical protein M1834_000755 [Cirrosporium novae-zelandiae]
MAWSTQGSKTPMASKTTGGAQPPTTHSTLPTITNEVGHGPSLSCSKRDTKKRNGNSPHVSKAHATESSTSAVSETEDGSSSESGSDADEEDEEDDDEDLHAPSRGDGRSSLGFNGHEMGHANDFAGKKRKLSTLSTSSSESDDSDRTVLPNSPIQSPAKKVATFFSAPEGDSNDEDDDDYNAVEEIDDFEDDPEVENVEERMIIAEAEKEDRPAMASLRAASPSPSVSSTVSWGGLELNDAIFHPHPFFDDEVDFLFDNGHFPELLGGSDVGAQSGTLDDELDLPLSERHVHFEDVVRRYSDSSSSSSSNEDNWFPDLFLQQDSLDPEFRRTIENDANMDDGHLSSDEGSIWDIEGDEELALEHQALDDASDSGSSCGNSSGYESDQGDSTDEELPPPETISRPRAILRQVSPSSPTPEKEDKKGKKPRRTNMRTQRGPSMGTWIADRSKPIAVMDSTGKRMIIYPARTPSKNDGTWSAAASGESSPIIGSARTSIGGGLFDDSENDRSDFSGRDIFSSPMLSSGINLMMSGIFQGAPGEETLRGGQVLGPPEAFYQFRSVGIDGTIEEEDEDIDFDDINPDSMLNVGDFVDLDDGNSQDAGNQDQDQDQDMHIQTTPHPSTSNAPLTTPSSPLRTDDIIGHFSYGLVTAFKRNQSRHQSFLRRPPHREFMPAGSALRGRSAIKFGRIAGANSPISPARRRRPDLTGNSVLKRRIRSANNTNASSFSKRH